MDLKLAAEMAALLPTIDEAWTFSSGPGWYVDPDGDEWPMFWDGHRWHNPVQDIEERITAIIAPHLEDMFKQGFLAGMVAGAESDKERA